MGGEAAAAAAARPAVAPKFGWTWEKAAAHPNKYKVGAKGGAPLREGWEPDSAIIGRLDFEEKLDALDSRLVRPGGSVPKEELRARFGESLGRRLVMLIDGSDRYGWVAVKDERGGTVLKKLKKAAKPKSKQAASPPAGNGAVGGGCSGGASGVA